MALGLNGNTPHVRKPAMTLPGEMALAHLCLETPLSSMHGSGSEHQNLWFGGIECPDALTHPTMETCPFFLEARYCTFFVPLTATTFGGLGSTTFIDITYLWQLIHQSIFHIPPKRLAGARNTGSWSLLSTAFILEWAVVSHWSVSVGWRSRNLRHHPSLICDHLRIPFSYSYPHDISRLCHIQPQHISWGNLPAPFLHNLNTA